jgi:secondary thiamine-phosphate synthase enzyme
METYLGTTLQEDRLAPNQRTETLRQPSPRGGLQRATPDGGTSRHALLHVTTRRATEFVDITDRLAAIVATCGLRARLINIQTLHTTTGIVVNEHEPLLLTDFESTLEQAAPADSCYHHDDLSVRTVNLTPDERINGHAHCRALLLPVSACLNVVNGRLLLGRWQRVFLVELDGPRERTLSLMVFGEVACPADLDLETSRSGGGGE